MARLDHIAYRVKCRDKTAQFFIDAFGYKVQKEFPLQFDDGTTCQCIALEPPEKLPDVNPPWIAKCFSSPPNLDTDAFGLPELQEYHLPCETFVSSSDEPGNIVYEWVKKRDGIGGIHHIAWQVESVEKIMAEWREKGYAEFTTEKPLKCPEDNLIQVFTKPSELTGGIIFEFIQRGQHGFCSTNVKNLMISTKGL